MSARAIKPVRLGVVATAALLTLAGCGRLNRTVTINQVKTTSGATAATALEQQLGRLGLSAARVSCAETLIVHVGATNSCVLTRAGKTGIVRFSFRSSRGEINPASVKAL